MLENVGTKVARNKEIPPLLVILEKEIKEQGQIIKTLRETLHMVLCERPLEVVEDKDTIPDCSPLGGKIKSSNRQLMFNTKEISRIIDDLEL